MSDPCGTCGRYPLADDPEATEALLRAIRADADGRLSNAETWMRLATVADRVAAVSWFDALLSRPPLRGRSEAFAAIRFLVSSLVADIEQTAISGESPEIAGVGIVPEPAPALYEPIAEPSHSTLAELKERLAGILP